MVFLLLWGIWTLRFWYIGESSGLVRLRACCAKAFAWEHLEGDACKFIFLLFKRSVEHSRKNRLNLLSAVESSSAQPCFRSELTLSWVWFFAGEMNLLAPSVKRWRKALLLNDFCFWVLAHLFARLCWGLVELLHSSLVHSFTGMSISTLGVYRYTDKSQFPSWLGHLAWF